MAEGQTYVMEKRWASLWAGLDLRLNQSGSPAVSGATGGCVVKRVPVSESLCMCINVYPPPNVFKRMHHSTGGCHIL